MASDEEKALQEIPWHSWSDTGEVLKKLGTSLDGLTVDEAAARLQRCAMSSDCCALARCTTPYMTSRGDGGVRGAGKRPGVARSKD